MRVTHVIVYIFGRLSFLVFVPRLLSQKVIVIIFYIFGRARFPFVLKAYNGAAHCLSRRFGRFHSSSVRGKRRRRRATDFNVSEISTRNPDVGRSNIKYTVRCRRVAHVLYNSTRVTGGRNKRGEKMNKRDDRKNGISEFQILLLYNETNTIILHLSCFSSRAETAAAAACILSCTLF